MYLNNTAHRAGARPEATHNTPPRHSKVSNPVGHAVFRPVHAPAKGRQRIRPGRPSPRKQKKGGGRTSKKLLEQAIGGALPAPLGQTHQPGEAENGRSHSNRPAKPNKHPTKAGNPPARRDNGRHPQGPQLGHRETTPPSPQTGPDQRRQTTTATGPLHPYKYQLLRPRAADFGGSSSAPSVSLMAELSQLTPPPPESMGNQVGPPCMPRPEARAHGHTPAC